MGRHAVVGGGGAGGHGLLGGPYSLGRHAVCVWGGGRGSRANRGTILNG